MDVNIKEILINGQIELKKNNIDIAEARLLLAFVLKVEQHALVTIDKCNIDVANKYYKCIQERISGIPYAYIVGKQEFMKLPFIVTKDVLIPRHDTEILVENVLDMVNEIQKEHVDILDMCTGSGCIAIALAKYIGNCNVTGVDVSQKALDIASRNAHLNNVNVKYILSNLFENLDDNIKYDYIVSNPPYIKTEDIKLLQNEVKNEPILALDGGQEGLDIYKRIIIQAKKYLKFNSYLILEIGCNQANDIVELLKNNLYKEIKVIKDLANNDRVVIGKI